jgi:hypothetical protein
VTKYDDLDLVGDITSHGEREQLQNEPNKCVPQRQDHGPQHSRIGTPRHAQTRTSDTLTGFTGGTPFLLPELVAPALASTGRAMWLLPIPNFTARNLGARNEPQPTKVASERERAHRLWLERDAELTALMRLDAVRLGLTEADGSLSLDDDRTGPSGVPRAGD